MNHLTNERPARPMLRPALLALLIPGVLAAGSRPAAAETNSEVRIAADAADPHDIRRRIAVAARRLCAKGGVESIHRKGEEKCRKEAVADAERQLEARLAARHGVIASRPIEAARSGSDGAAGED